MKKQKGKGTEQDLEFIEQKNDNSKNNLNSLEAIRYSDKELNEFKGLIIKKINEAKTDYHLLQGTLSRQHHKTDDTYPTFKLTEDAPDIFTKEEVAQLAITQKKLIEQLQNALIRIENKTFGICKISGKLISKERLKSFPQTMLSIDAKLDLIHLN